MPNCAVKSCKNYTSKCSKKHGISYYRFPKDPLKAEKWVQIIRDVRRDPNWKVNDSHRVCSRHFNKEKDFAYSQLGYMKLTRDAVPHLAMEPEPEPPASPLCPATPEETAPLEEDVGELKDFLDDDSVLGFDLNVFTDMFDSPKEKKFMSEIKKLEKSRKKYRNRARLLTRTNTRLKAKIAELMQEARVLRYKYRRVGKKIKTRNVEVNTTDDIFFLL